MSFGYGTGDVILLAQLAWSVYKSCKEAPDHFQVLTGEVMRLHVVLKETDEALRHIKLSEEQQESLNSLSDGCGDALKELEALVTKFQSLGTQSRRTFDRLKWAQDDVRQLRERVVNSVGMLTAFNATITMVSQVRLEKLLKEFLEDYRSGRREGSVIASVAEDEADIEDEDTWRQLAEELQDSGVPVALLLERKDDIVAWFVNAEKTGELGIPTPALEFSDTDKAVQRPPISPPTTGNKTEIPNGTNSVPAIVTTTALRPEAPLHSKSDSVFAKLRQAAGRLPAKSWGRRRRSQSPLPPTAAPTPQPTTILAMPNSAPVELEKKKKKKKDSPPPTTSSISPPPAYNPSIPTSPADDNDDVVTGNFHLNASDIKLKRGHLLSALLENENGEMVSDEFDLDETLGNLTGCFNWGDHNFSHSARGIKLNLEDMEDQGPVLEAELLTLDRIWNPAVLYLGDFLANRNGKFVVVKRFRKY